MRYLIIDGMLNGTGIRDEYGDGYLNIESLGLSESLRLDFQAWLQRYAQEHFENYTNRDCLTDLDNKGIELARRVMVELGENKITYFSDAFLTLHSIRNL